MKKKLLPALIVTGLIILVVIIMGITALINKYTPTKKTEDLKEYFNISSDDEAALIVDNELSDYKAKIIDKKIYVDFTGMQMRMCFFTQPHLISSQLRLTAIATVSPSRPMTLAIRS